MTSSEIINFYHSVDTETLSKKANLVCESIYGNKVYLRGLIEFSNYCQCDCLYCGIRKSNPHVQRYRLPQQSILEIVKAGYKRGLKTFVLQSGEDSYYTTKMLTEIIEKIKLLTNNEAAVTLSCGMKSKNDYQSLKSAGADRYLIRFETSDPKFHQYLRGGISFKRRLKALEDLKTCGFEVGSGYMVGLPDETEQTRINNALLCNELELDMLGVGPFIPHPKTPLKTASLHNIELTIRATALARLLLPGANIPATTAAGSLDPLGREKVLQVGANVLMPNITPPDNKKNYLLYPGKICLDESGFECMGCLNNRIATIDKKLSLERGDAKTRLCATP
ncbi:MAG: [FeFe] hydrogenase H-cluster radical SAM maturase HydE [Spirochaetes bacterium]|nr:[FeFe] hydrogenase H-cluster radical SAM maturase HydE [Spirochaetota bacterium]